MRYRKGSEEPYASLWRLRLVPTFWDIGGERARHAAKRFSGGRRNLLENHHLGIQNLRKLVQCCNGKVGRQPPAWVGGEEAARRRPLWQHATRRQGGARPVCLTQDWIGPTGDTSKQRFGSTKLKV
jgi:hypothetical protein